MTAHPQREEDFDLYALGALDTDERREIETHLASCPDCARKLAEAKGRVALLSLAAPPVAPSAGARQRLMARVHADAASNDLRQGTPPVPKSERKGVLTPEGYRGLSRWWAAILVPAAGVLAIATVVLWQQNEKLDHQLAALNQAVHQQQAQLTEATHLADLIGSTDTATVNLAMQPGQAKGVAHVMYNMKMGMLMYDGQLDPAPADKSYQLWIVPASGAPISAGVFNPTSGQTDHWMMAMPTGVTPKAFAVTLEPKGGMPQPTGPKVLIGVAS